MSSKSCTFAAENRKNEDYEKVDDIKRMLGYEPRNRSTKLSYDKP